MLVEKLATARETVSSRLSSFQKCFQPKPKATNLKLYQSAWVKDKIVLSVVVRVVREPKARRL